MADLRFDQSSALPPPKPRFAPVNTAPPTRFQAVDGAFDQYQPTQQDKMRRMFGTDTPIEDSVEQTPAAKFGQSVTRFKEKTADKIQKFVQDHPADADLLRPAPLTSWAKSAATALAKVPFRIARLAAQGADTIDPFQRFIPDSVLKIPKVEDSVLSVAASIGLPLEDAQKTAKESPGLLQSLHDAFILPVRNGLEIASMPDGKEKQDAYDAWAYKTAQSFVSGMSVGVTDEMLRDNAITLENGEIMWKGVPISALSETEQKGVSAGGLSGQLLGGIATYAMVSPMLTESLRSIPVLNKLYEQHPFLSSAILTNAAQEGFEAVVRKSSGQDYSFKDTLMGMMSGLVFETGKLAVDGLKGDAPAQLDGVRSFLEGEVRGFTNENGRLPDMNELRSRIGDKVVPGTNVTVEALHNELAASGIKEQRMIEMKGGKKGTPGMDFPAEPPKGQTPEVDMPALIKEFGSEDAIPLDRLSPHGVADAAAGEAILKAGGTIEEADAVAGTPILSRPESVVRKVGDVPQVFRTDKFNVDDAGQARLKVVQETLGMTTRDVRTWPEVEAMAKEIGVNPMKLMKTLEGTKLLSDAQVEALRQTSQSASNFLAQKHDLLEEARSRGDTAAITEIEQKVKVNEKLLNDAVGKLIKGGTELGRGVAIYRKIAAEKMGDPTYWYKEAMELIDEGGPRKVRFGGKKVDVKPGEIPEGLRVAIDSMMKSGDQLGLAQLMAGLKVTGNADKLITLWKAGLLTAPTTDLANMGGNLTMMALETAKDIPATMVDYLMSGAKKVSNKILKTDFNAERTRTITSSMLRAQTEGIFEGAGKAKSILKTGYDPDNLMNKWDLRPTVNYNSAILQGYTEAVFRRLSAGDAIFRTSTVRRSLMESAELKVMNMPEAELSKALGGLPEDAPRTKRSLVDHFYRNPTKEAEMRAINDAEYATFQQSNWLSDAVSSAKNSTNGIGRAAMEFVIPFSKTPTNVAFSIVDYSPVGIVAELAKQIHGGGNQRNFTAAAGRATVGTSVMALGSMLASQGLMTGNAPESESERKLWEAAGKQAHSVFFNGAWRRIDRFSPLGNLLVIGAEFNELGKTKTAAEQWTQIGWSGVRSVTEQSFLLGMSQALRAVNEPDKYAESFAENAIRGIVPNILSKIGEGTDEFKRDVGTFNPIAVLQSRLPFLRNTLPARRDVLGKKMKEQGGLLGKLLDPFSSMTPSDDPLTKEYLRLGVAPSSPNRRLYDDKEYRALLRIRGATMVPALTEVISDPAYKQMSDELKQRALSDIDTAITREVHGVIRQAAAQRHLEEIRKMSSVDQKKKLKDIKDKNSSMYEMILYLDSINQ